MRSFYDCGFCTIILSGELNKYSGSLATGKEGKVSGLKKVLINKKGRVTALQRGDQLICLQCVTKYFKNLLGTTNTK